MVGSISGSASPALQAPASKSDPIADSIRKQIAALQKQKEEIGRSDKLTPEQKQEKQKEVEEQIAALKQQLQQHEIQKRAQETKEQAEAIKEQAERFEQEKPPEEQAKDVQRELTYGFALSESHLYSAKGAQSAFTAAKGQNALAEAQAKSFNGSSASPEAVAGSSGAMDRAMSFRGESFKKAAGAMGRMNERLGDLNRAASKNESEEEAGAAKASDEANETGAVQGAPVSDSEDVAAEAALPGANRQDENVKGDKNREDEEERRRKHIDILL